MDDLLLSLGRSTHFAIKIHLVLFNEFNDQTPARILFRNRSPTHGGLNILEESTFKKSMLFAIRYPNL